MSDCGSWVSAMRSPHAPSPIAAHSKRCSEYIGRGRPQAQPPVRMRYTRAAPSICTTCSRPPGGCLAWPMPLVIIGLAGLFGIHAIALSALVWLNRRGRLRNTLAAIVYVTVREQHEPFRDPPASPVPINKPEVVAAQMRDDENVAFAGLILSLHQAQWRSAHADWDISSRPTSSRPSTSESARRSPWLTTGACRRRLAPSAPTCSDRVSHRKVRRRRE